MEKIYLESDFDPLGRKIAYGKHNNPSYNLSFRGIYRNVFGNSAHLFHCKGEEF